MTWHSCGTDPTAPSVPTGLLRLPAAMSAIPIATDSRCPVLVRSGSSRNGTNTPATITAKPATRAGLARVSTLAASTAYIA